MSANMRASVYAVEPLIRPSAALTATVSAPGGEKGIRLRRVFHGVGDEVVHRGPRVARLGGERVAQAVLERPQQRFAKGRVVLLLHAVRGVAPSERADAGDDAV